MTTDTLKRIKVVNIWTGTGFGADGAPPTEVAATDWSVWWLSHLTKKGKAPGNRGPDGGLYSGREVTSHYYAWAEYDEAREQQAAPIRTKLAQMQAERLETERRLFALYAKEREE